MTLAELAERLNPEDLAAADDLVSAAPPMSQAQIDRIATLLAPQVECRVA